MGDKTKEYQTLQIRLLKFKACQGFSRHVEALLDFSESTFPQLTPKLQNLTKAQMLITKKLLWYHPL